MSFASRHKHQKVMTPARPTNPQPLAYSPAMLQVTKRLKNCFGNFRKRAQVATQILFHRQVDPCLLACVLRGESAIPTAGIKLLDETEYARLHQISKAVEQLSQELSIARGAAASRQLSSLAAVADCDRFVSRIIRNLATARETSEKAVLAIGNHVSRLFKVAKDDNDLSISVFNRVLGSNKVGAGKGAEPLASIVDRQEKSVNDFIRETQTFFCRQFELTLDVDDACADMKQCVSRINQLVFSSELLAFNVRVEALRLGDHGSPFAVLAEELVKFSQSIKAINLDIQRSLSAVAERTVACHDQTSVMKGRLAKFAEDLSEQMSEVQARTRELTDSLASTLSHISESNQVLMTASQEALSALQFQDPLSQDMKRTAHEVYKLKRLFETGYCEDTNVADVDPAVARTRTISCQAGTVNWF